MRESPEERGTAAAAGVSTIDPAGSGEGEGGPRPAGRRSWREWYVPLLTLAATAFCLGPSLVGARTLISVNSLTNFAPWAVAGNDSAGHQLCQSDTIDSVLPAVAYMRRQIFSGHLGSWQSLQAGGGPLASLPNAGLLDPLALPYWVLPLSWAPAFCILLCWVAAIGGTFLFLRRLAVGRPAAVLAGFVFATSGFMVMWTNWPQSRTAALIPLLFWAAERVATRARPLDLVLLAAVVASMLFGGFPAVTGWALYMAAGYFVVRVLFRHRGDWPARLRATGLAAGGLVLGVALSAVQMLPFLDFYRTDNLAYRTGESAAGLPLGGLVTLFAPNSNGLCLIGQPVNGSVNPVELVSYVGAAALVLAVVGAAFAARDRRGRQGGARGYLLVAVAVAVLLCWVSPGARSAVSSLPVFAGNFIGRIRSVVDFGLAALAGFGFDWLVSRRKARPAGGAGRDPAGSHRRARPRWARALWPTAVGAAAVAAGVLVIRAGHRDAVSGHYLSAWENAVWIPAVLLGASLLVAAAAALGRAGPRRLAFAVLPVLVVAQGSQFFHAVMPGDNPASFYPPTGDHSFLTAHLGHDRFASANLTYYPSTAFYYGLRSATGHQFTDSRWNDLLSAVDPSVLMSGTNSDFEGGVLNSHDIGHQPILDQMGVKYFVLPSTDLAGAPDPLAPVTGALSSARGPLTCTLPGGPLRGVTVRLAGPLQPAAALQGATIDVSVTGAGVHRSSGMYLRAGVAAGSQIYIPLAGEDLPAGTPLTVALSAGGTAAPLVLAAAGGSVDCAAVRPQADGLRLVYAAPGALIYQRLDALARIRWASAATVMASPAAQKAAMKAGLPPSSVLLSSPGPAPSGRGATVAVGRDSGDRITATVRAGGGGYLLVSDAMQVPGWSVTVDGRPAVLRAADYAMVAVWVPGGVHRVSFTYRAPGQVAGAGLTGAALLVAAALIWWDAYGSAAARRSPRRRRRFRSGPGPA